MAAYVDENYKQAFAIIADRVHHTDTAGMVREYVQQIVDDYCKKNPQSDAAKRLKGR